MPGDQTQVVAGRNLIVYTEPWQPSNAFPADAIPWGQTWGGTWVDKGFTSGGLHVRLAVQRQDILVDQQVDPVLRIPTSRDITMECRLAQINMANLAEGTGQGTPTTVAGHDELQISGTIIDQYITTGYDILNPGDNKPVRVVGWKGFATGDVTLDFVVNDAAQISFNHAIVPDTSAAPPRIIWFRDLT
ncbi:MAG TPA: hypothetical protein VGJ60_07665 [Chloroflexota bacterium]|jgi:hypothetical protein